MNTWKKAVFASALAILLGGSVAGQNTPSSGSGSGAANVSSGVLRGVTDKPYSAIETTEQRRTLADGTYIETKTTVKQWRDSQGRMRQEIWRTVPGGNQDRPEATVISIFDPVAGVIWSLRPETHMAFRRVPQPQRLPTHAAVREPIARSPSLKPERHTEQLGTQELEGVEAQGTRTTTIIPTGWEGNSAPIVTVDETWLSPDLKIVLMSKRTDPENGDATMGMSNLDRSEPDPTLFQVPADYTIKDQ